MESACRYPKPSIIDFDQHNCGIEVGALQPPSITRHANPNLAVFSTTGTRENVKMGCTVGLVP